MIKVRRLSLVAFSLVMLLALTTSSVFAETKSTNEPVRVTTVEEIKANGNVIHFFAPANELEAAEIVRQVYAETPSITMAEEVTAGAFHNALAANTLPYYFSFDFNAALTSQTITNNTAGTIRITASGSWVEATEWIGTELDYYDITLYAGGKSQGTKRFKTGSWRHADWTDVPKGNIYFKMTKSPYTHGDPKTPEINNNIAGDGTVLNQ